MKNLLLKLLTIIFALTLCLGIFTACGDTSETPNPPAHTHDYKTLKYNETSHWYECECGEKSNLAVHNLINNKCICGYEVEVHTHDYKILKYNENSHWLECECKAKLNVEYHKGGIATETKKAVCSVCNQEYGALLEHTHDYKTLKFNETSHWYECECGEKQSVENHKGGTATCKEKASCEVCREKYGELGECNYVNNICTVCGGGNTPPEYTVEGTAGLKYTVYGQGDDKYAVFTGLTKDCTEKDIIIASHYQGVKVTEIGDGVNYLSNFKEVESVKIHKYVKLINSSAFNGSTALKKIDFEDECQLEKIGGSAFKNAKKLENFNYKGKINFLGDGAFAGCESLKTTAYEGAEYIGSNLNPYLILLNGTEAESVKVHKDCEAIHSSAFEENATTKTITFESNDTLLSIGGLAFSKSAITEITIPKTVTNIGESAFYAANSLKTVTFDKESELTILGDCAFKRCEKLEEVKNFECTKITEMSEGLFSFYDNATYPSSLKYINIPKTVTLIKKNCMWQCVNLESINFPKDINLVEIQYHAFRGCKKVKTLIIPKTVERIGYDIIAWGNTDLKIFCEAESEKVGWYNMRWNEYQSGNTGVLHATYYYSDTYKAGAWHYVNGEPTLWY